MNRSTMYEVIFEKTYNPSDDINANEVRELSIVLLGTSINDAIENAWKAVAIPADKYEIVSSRLIGYKSRLSRDY